MGRPERPIDPDAGPVAEFATELRKLRDEAGRPSYREMAKRAAFSVTVLSEAAGGRSLATLPVVRGYVQACGGDVAEWEQRWRAIAGEQRAVDNGRATAATNGHHADLANLPHVETESLDGSNAAEATVFPDRGETSPQTPLATNRGETSPRTLLARSARRLRGLVAAIAVVAVAASVAVAVAISHRDAAASAASDATSRRLAAQSEALASVNPDAAALAALAAWHAGPTVEARSALLSTATCCSSTQTIAGAPVTGLAITGNPAVITSVTKDGMLDSWSEGGRLITSTDLKGRPVAFAADPGGKKFAVVRADGNASVRDIPQLDVSRRWKIRGSVTGVAFSSDGGTVAIADETQVSRWDAVRGARIWGSTYLKRNQGLFTAIAFDPAGPEAAAATSRGSVLIWNTSTGQLIAKTAPGTGPVNAIAFSHDGQFLATAGSGGIITVWNAANLHRMTSQPGSIAPIRALAFSPGDRILASGGNYGTILLWDTASLSASRASLSEMASLADGATVNTLAFDPTGSTLVSGDSAKRIIAWNVNPADVVRTDCQMLAHAPGLARAETLVRNASFPQICLPPGLRPR